MTPERRPVGAAGTGMAAVVLLLIGAGLGAWVARSTDERPVAGPNALPTGVQASFDAALASSAETRLRSFRTGEAGPRLVLYGDEITAVLRHTVPGMLPPGVSEPVVRLEAGLVWVDARVASEVFPGSPILRPVLGVLPDTIDVEVRGTLVREGQRLALRIDRVSAGHVPLPRSVVTSIVAAIGGDASAVDEGGPALRVAWPAGVTAMNVTGDRLVLERRAGRRTVDGLP